MPIRNNKTQENNEKTCKNNEKHEKNTQKHEKTQENDIKTQKNMEIRMQNAIEARELLKEAAKVNLADFAEVVFDYDNSKHHQEWYNILMNKLMSPKDGDMDAELVPAPKGWVNERIGVMAPRSHAKALKLDTKVYTENGSETIKNIKIGQKIIGNDGKLTKIIGKSQIFHKKCYEIVFSNGETITASEDHLWSVITKSKSDYYSTAKTITTSDVKVGMLLPHIEPITSFTKKHYDIDPYTLGVWLGDGTSSSGSVTTPDDFIMEKIHGYRVGSRLLVRVPNLTSKLRKCNLKGNKHIPDIYQYGDYEQRRSLICGLMDTDGTVMHDGTYQFDNTNLQIIKGLQKLLRSFGVTTNIRKSKGRYKRDGEVIECKDTYRLQFQSDIDFFTLPRKLNKHKKGTTRKRYIRIESIREVESTPTQCLMVDNESKLFLCGETYLPTHNSSCFTVVYPLWVIGNNPNIRILIVSNSASQAQAFLREIKDKITKNSMYKEMFGDLFPEDSNEPGEKWTNQEIIVRRKATHKDPTVSAMGAGGAILSKRADIIICDDILNLENTRNAAQRENIKQWYNEVLMPVLEPNGILINVGCIQEDAMVLLANGTWKKIKDIKVGELVTSVDENTGKRVRKKVTAVLPQGEHETIKVATKRHKLDVTPNHPFMVLENGRLSWKRADEISIGDTLVGIKANRHGYKKRTQFGFAGKDFCWLFGFLIGDGWVSNGSGWSICFSPGVNEELNKKVCLLFERFFGRKPTLRGNYYRLDTKLGKDIYELGLNKHATEKRIPEWVFKSRMSERSAFIEGLIAADGNTVSKNTSRVELNNEMLVNDLRLLAIESSYVVGKVLKRTRTIQPPNSKAPREFTSWSISLRKESWQYKGIHNVVDYNIDFRGLSFDTVETVENSKKQSVYDITVEETHNFIADGLVVHNTAWNLEDLLHEQLKNPSYDVRKRYKAILPDGTALWQERWSIEKLMELKEEVGSVAFNKSYMNEALSSEDSVFKYEWLQKAKEIGKKLSFAYTYRPESWTLPVQPKAIALGVDLAISDKDSGDYTAFAVVAELMNGAKIPLWLEEAKLDFAKTERKIIELCGRYQCDIVVVENNGYQAALVRDLQGKTSLPIVPYSTGGEKYDLNVGINSLAVEFENEKWILPYNTQKDSNGDLPSPFTVKFVDRLCDYMMRFGSGHTGDLLMATWFANGGLRQLTFNKSGEEGYAYGSKVDILHR